MWEDRNDEGQKGVVGLLSSEELLNPTPYTLHPTPYTLHPSPYTLHPTTPYTLHRNVTLIITVMMRGRRELSVFSPPRSTHRGSMSVSTIRFTTLLGQERV